MSKRENRQDQRIPYFGSARISWEDEQGLTRYAHAKCLDVSKGGLRIELGEPIPVRSRLLLRANLIDVGGSATVRHTAWRGCKYILGLGLSHTLHDDALAAIRDSSAIRNLCLTP
jgi:PilZ domain